MIWNKKQQRGDVQWFAFDIFSVKQYSGEQMCSVPCESRGLAGSSAQREPGMDSFPSPVWTTEPESGKGPADRRESLD